MLSKVTSATQSSVSPVKVTDKVAAVSKKPSANPRRIDPIKLRNATEAMNKYFRTMNMRISLELDQKLDRPIIRVIDTQTNRVVKQIPSEEVVRMLHKFDELLGLFVDEMR